MDINSKFRLIGNRFLKDEIKVTTLSVTGFYKAQSGCQITVIGSHKTKSTSHISP